MFAPIAISSAETLESSPSLFALAVLIAVSSVFMPPVSPPVSPPVVSLVVAPGRYRCIGFFKGAVPRLLLTSLVTLFLVSVLFPLSFASCLAQDLQRRVRLLVNSSSVSPHRGLLASLSVVGVVFGTLLFCASLTPSLIPRTYVVQGVESGFALATGYGFGVGVHWLWQCLELPVLAARWICFGKRITLACLGCLVLVTLWRATVWENSIRSLMEMEPVRGVYSPYVVMISIPLAFVLLMMARAFRSVYGLVDRRLRRILSRRYSYLMGTFLVILAVLTLTTNLVIKPTLRIADRAFLEIDGFVYEGIERPASALASGSVDSLIDWDVLSRRGKDFVVSGPERGQIAEFIGREAKPPLRVYVGLGCRATAQQRAELALQELIRVGGFERSVLVVANPTGTGWLQPEAVDTIEYLHAGDTAIVTIQYSYLPSWLTLLVDPEGSRDSARVLFETIYGHWRSLPPESRPRLYLHGLSLGAYGSETCADLFTLFEDPIQGAVWSGPPFPSTSWADITKARNADSPVWLPTFRDGRIVRFTARENALKNTGKPWGPMRFVYIQHASDPMTFFSTELLYQRPQWLSGERGPDISPYMSWYPIVTFLQVGFDLPMATSVPAGYGHNLSAASYIDAWIAVTAPVNWSDEETKRLKLLFAENPEAL